LSQERVGLCKSVEYFKFVKSSINLLLYAYSLVYKQSLGEWFYQRKYMRGLKLTSLLIMLALAACTCQSHDLYGFSAIYYKDIKLSCRQLQLEIIKARHYENLAYNHKTNPITYSPFSFGCAPSTYAEGKKTLLDARHRQEYLMQLYQQKNCEVSKPPSKERAPNPALEQNVPSSPDDGTAQFIEIPTTEEINKTG
jgi:hypothetical protein